MPSILGRTLIVVVFLIVFSCHPCNRLHRLLMSILLRRQWRSSIKESERKGKVLSATCKLRLCDDICFSSKLYSHNCDAVKSDLIKGHFPNHLVNFYVNRAVQCKLVAVACALCVHKTIQQLLHGAFMSATKVKYEKRQRRIKNECGYAPFCLVHIQEKSPRVYFSWQDTSFN